jgi:hypothetical protein
MEPDLVWEVERPITVAGCGRSVLSFDGRAETSCPEQSEHSNVLFSVWPREMNG